MLLFVPIFEEEDDLVLTMNEEEQEGFLKAFTAIVEAEEYILSKGYTRNDKSLYDVDDPYAYIKGRYNNYSARIMSCGTPTHGSW